LHDAGLLNCVNKGTQWSVSKMDNTMSISDNQRFISFALKIRSSNKIIKHKATLNYNNMTERKKAAPLRSGQLCA